MFNHVSGIEFNRILGNPYLGDDIFTDIIYSDSSVIIALEQELPRRKVKNPLEKGSHSFSTVGVIEK